MKKFDFEDRKILLVGGAGYVGSVMAEMFLQQGASVHVLDNFLYGNGHTIVHLLEDQNFSYSVADFRDQSAFYKSLKGVSDVVLLASLVGDPITKSYPNLAERTNKDASIRLFDALNNSSVERFIFTSTCSNYGIFDGEELATEEAALNPQSLYAETKIAVEQYILGHLEGLSFSPTILRISTAYGLSPRMRFDLTISDFTWTLANDEPLLVYDADTWRPYCHIRDIAKACMTVFEQPREKVAGEIFNVGDESQQFTKRMIVEEISKHLVQTNIEYKQGATDPRDYRVSFTKIARQLDFTCEHSVQEYIPELVKCLNEGMFPETRKREYGNYEIPGAT